MLLATTLWGCTPTSSPSALSVEIDLVAGEPSDGVRRIETVTGSTVRLTVTSDTVDVIHVHGYDLEFTVGPQSPGEVEFAADITGAFEIETHEDPSVIAQLVVR